METPHARKPYRPARRAPERQQQKLAILAATLGLLLGAMAGVATAAPATTIRPDSALVAGGQPAGAAGVEAAAAPAPADPVPMAWSPVQGDAGLSLGPLIAKVSLGLGLVVLLAWGTVYLLRRSALGQVANGASTVRVLDRNWLGPKKAIYLVDIAGRTLALGVTEESIRLLTSWEAGEIDLPPPAPGAGAFAHQLKGLLRRGETGRDAALAGEVRP